MKEYCKRFFLDLYKRRASNSSRKEAKEMFFMNMKDRILDLSKKTLITPMLGRILKALPKRKLFVQMMVIEFFLSLWDVIKKEYVNMV